MLLSASSFSGPDFVRSPLWWWLVRFPLNKLKIDRSFVTQIPDSGHGNAVASTIVAMAYCLGLGVIAEGVETQDQTAFLRFIGCEEMR